MRNQILNTIKIVFLGLILSASLAFAASSGWVDPTTSPTGGNIEPPINTGSAMQIKSGNLAAQTLLALQEVWAGTNIRASGASITHPMPAGFPANADGMVFANWFCLTPTTYGSPNNCINQWPTAAGGLPNGFTGQTIRNDGTGWVANSTLINSGTMISSNAPLTITMPGATSLIPYPVSDFNPTQNTVPVDTSALLLNTNTTAQYGQIVTNRPALRFWSSANGGQADILVRDVKALGTVYAGKDVYAGTLSNPTGNPVCADSLGKLILCTGFTVTPGTGPSGNVGHP